MLPIIYSPDSINKIFFHQFTNVFFDNNNLILRNTVFKNTVSIKCTEDQAQNLCSILNNGAEFDELQNIIQNITQEENVSNIVNILIQRRIIE